jgi:hypothetical protein
MMKKKSGMKKKSSGSSMKKKSGMKKKSMK